jgi:hypothetical protein
LIEIRGYQDKIFNLEKDIDNRRREKEEIIFKNIEKDNQIKMLEYKLNRQIDEGAGSFADKL